MNETRGTDNLTRETVVDLDGLVTRIENRAGEWQPERTFDLRPGRDLYLFQNTVTGWVKIGSTNNVERRRREIERACGMPIDVLREVKGEGDFEGELHAAFAPVRLIGEWFLPVPELIEWAGSSYDPEFLAIDGWSLGEWGEEWNDNDD